MTQVLYNFKSCDFFTDQPIAADPDHPDYVGYDLPLYVVDPTLQSEEAVNLVARRVFDVSCLSTRVASFMGPLLFIEHEDDAARVRPLRFYDPITITRFGVDTTWLVRSVNPIYDNDVAQMAMYEIEAPREPFL